MKFNLLRWLVPVLIILNIALVAVYLKGSIKSQSSANVTDNFPEITELQGKNMSFEELKNYFTSLAQKKSAKYALDVLKVAPVAPNTDMHLLGHALGDILYRQLGIEGIKICTEDFRNACSHSIVIGLFSDKGEGALPEIAQACRQAPGGKGAYTMCFHGLGHGILAFTGYNFPKTAELCQKTGTPQYGNQESAQCHSGAVMEIISGGGHDKPLWESQRKKYLLADNPFYPCTNLVPNSSKELCYTYITPYLWEVVGANLGNPKEDDFVKSFALCNKIPEKDSIHKNICFGGFGKEFVALSASRDIRKVDQMDDSQLSQVYQWCQLTDNQDGLKSCLQQALSSLYWGGENDRGASIRFCNIITDPNLKSDCFTNLISQVASYIDDPNYKKSFCQEVQAEFTTECKNNLKII